MNESTQIKYHGKTLWQWIKPSRRVIKGCSLLALIAIVAIWLFAQYWAYNRFEPFVVQSIGENEYTELKAFWDQKLDFPEQCAAQIPISKEFKQAYEEARKKYVRYEDPKKDSIQEGLKWNRLSRLGAISDEEFPKGIEILDPYLKAGLHLSKQIINTIAPLSPNDPLPLYDPDHPYHNMRDNIRNTFTIKAKNSIYHKNYNEAFDYYIAQFPLLVDTPYQYFTGYDQYLHHFNRYPVKETAGIVQMATSPTSLRAGLDTLNKLEPFLFLDIFDRYNELALIEQIGQYKRDFGDRFDAAPGKRCGEYIHQMAKLKFPHTRFFKSVPCLWQWAIAGRQLEDREIAGMLRFLSFSNAPDDYFDSQIYRLKDVKSARRFYYNAAADYDALRIIIAARLYELETGKKVTATTDLVPKYITEEIKDRQTGESYQWNQNDILWEFF